jgi:phage shock protein C
MSDSDELNKLADLHQRGALTDEEFARAKARILQGSATRTATEPLIQTVNGFRRSRDDRWLGGVCGGLAQMTGLASWALRLIFILLLLCGGTGALLYVLLWALVPLDQGSPGAAMSQH